MKHMKKNLGRNVLAMALCLVICASLFAVPAFAAGNTLVIVGGAAKDSAVTVVAEEPSTSVVVSGNGGSVSNGVAGNIAADVPASGTTVVVGGQAVNSASPAGADKAYVVQPDGTVNTVGGQAKAEATTSGTNDLATVVNATATAPAGLASQLLTLVNQKRAENGVGSVSYSPALQSIADLRAKESAVSFGHTRPDGSDCSTAVTVDWQVTGENLVQVTSEYATAEIMIDTWMNSATHRYNILLASFDEIAVGTFVQNGTTSVSLIFIGN